MFNGIASLWFFPVEEASAFSALGHVAGLFLLQKRIKVAGRITKLLKSLAPLFSPYGLSGLLLLFQMNLQRD